MKKKYNWKFLYLVWLKNNLEGDYPYLNLSKDENVPEKTIRNHAAKYKWQDKLAEARTKIEHQIISTVQAQKVFSEVEIRQRQANIAFQLQEKAMAKLKSVKPEKLSVRQAIEMAKLGLTEERKALGLPDKYEVANTNHNTGDIVSVEERKIRHEQADLLANKLFKYLSDNSPKTATAIKCNS